MMKKLLKAAFPALLLLLLSGAVLNAQNRITGTVKDANGEPIIAASVLVKGSSTNGTTTDVNGAYSLSVPANAVLVASCIGYADQEIAVGRGQTTVDFVLSEDNMFLEETVVIGYGTQKKSDVTGSVASVDSETMTKRAPTSIAQGLQGAAAGVVITQSSGDPTGGANIRIRGVATMNGDTNPLWVVDGVQYGTSSNLTWLDPMDVEHVEILKDASATAIYGARGANGVIMVTTRKGQ
ncbi:MAG: TonB-dependent receptor plug domain-containing protein, partial [Bacteroidales bacterium]|nr:TonB-dependent receptor plug domain-containing protein [Bacteroidales bacterium]